MFMLLAVLACADCHGKLAGEYARTPMANTSGPVAAAEEEAGRVGNLYRITPQMTLQWFGGQVDLTFFVGSRRMGRSYVYARDGYLFQAPVGYYANRKKWDLAPGYEHDRNPDLNRPITADCLACHATGAILAAGSINRYQSIGHGIQCARCHGGASVHEALVNPRKLSARARDSICDQCHLSGVVRLTQPSKRLEDFRPGEDLADYVEVFTGGPNKGIRVNGHSEALAASRCKRESGGKLWCGTCHSPHQRTASYASVCRSCHQKPHNNADCIECHMPKGKAYDGGHTVFTDHGLSLKPRQQAFASYFGRQPSPRNLGLAYVQIGRDRHDTHYFEQAWPLLRQAAAAHPRDPQLYSTIGALLEADGRKEQAEASYRLSLQHDPAQPEVLDRLAALLGSTGEGRKLREKSAAILPRPFQ